MVERRRLEAVLGEAEGPPEALGLLDGDAGLVGHLLGVEDGRLAQRWRVRGRPRSAPVHWPPRIMSPIGHPHVHHVPAPTAVSAVSVPESGRTVSRPPASRPVARPVSVAPPGRSTRTSRPTVTQARVYDARRSPAPPCHASYSSRSRARSASSSVVRSGRRPRQGERGGRRHRQLLGRGADVEPDPEHGRRAGRGVDALDEDPRDLEVPDQHVVGPLHAGVEARVAQRLPRRTR